MGQKDPDQSSSHPSQPSLSIASTFFLRFHSPTLLECVPNREWASLHCTTLAFKGDPECKRKKAVKIAEIATKPWCSFVHCVWHNSAATAFRQPLVDTDTVRFSHDSLYSGSAIHPVCLHLLIYFTRLILWWIFTRARTKMPAAHPQSQRRPPPLTPSQQLLGSEMETGRDATWMSSN